MADEPVESAEVVVQGEPQTETVGPAEELAQEIARSMEAAKPFFEPEPTAETPETPAPEPQPRDQKGQFVSTKPSLDNVWVEVAKRTGIDDKELAEVRDDTDLQRRIALRRIENMQRAGIDPSEYGAYQQWRQQQKAAPAPPVTPSVTTVTPPVTAPADLHLAYDPEEIAPEVIKHLQAIEAYTNQVKATLVRENEQLRRDLTGMRGYVEQSAQQAEVAVREARLASEWDAAAKGIPGFVETMGLPSEVRRLPRDDPKVQQMVAFQAYFEPVWNRYATALGPDAVPLQRVVADAFAASPFARLIPVPSGQEAAPNRTNGTGRGPGSVVRSSGQRPSAQEPVGSDLEAEQQRVMDRMRAAWNATGGNPFAAAHT